MTSGASTVSASDGIGPTPKQIGSYQVRHKLGQGRQGTVFLAYDPGTNQQVAIKLLSADGSEDEAQELGSLASKLELAVVRVMGSGLHGETPYFVMEYLERGTLQTRLAVLERSPNVGPIPVEHVLELVEALADIVGKLHDAGRFHLDLKPDNLLFRGPGPKSHQGVPKIIHADEKLVMIDFGSVETQTGGGTGMMRGTAGYAPPEVRLATGAAGRPSDVYAASAILVRVLSRENPVDPTDGQHLPFTPAAMAKTGQFRGVLERCLSPRMSDRPQSMADWHQLLQEAANDKATVAAAPGRQRPHRVWAATAAAVLTAVIATVAVASSLRTGADDSEQPIAGPTTSNDRPSSSEQTITAANVTLSPIGPEDPLTTVVAPDSTTAGPTETSVDATTSSISTPPTTITTAAPTTTNPTDDWPTTDRVRGQQPDRSDPTLNGNVFFYSGEYSTETRSFLNTSFEDRTTNTCYANPPLRESDQINLPIGNGYLVEVKHVDSGYISLDLQPNPNSLGEALTIFPCP